jgi:6-phosphogluconolactonase
VSFQQHAGSSVNRQRQQSPHAHSINLDAANRFAFVADLGLDQILIYGFDAHTGQLTPSTPPTSVSVPPGSGPRHFAFHPSGRFAYVINELASTIVAFRYEAQSGNLTPLQTISTLPEGFLESSSTAEIVVHPSGRFVYGSNRGHDSVAVFQVHAETGELTRVQIELTQGQTPRNFVVDPTGKFLLAENQGSNTIVVFRIDPQSGRLTPTGEELAAPVPVCIRFVAAE